MTTKFGRGLRKDRRSHHRGAEWIEHNPPIAERNTAVGYAIGHPVTMRQTTPEQTHE
jgi:hypothetical protein